ncbi:MAG: response regulator [Synergistaceae bacterium]|nr:response regulator [Synergistaceae bacterium]
MARIVIGLFCVSAILVFLSAVYENTKMNQHAANTHEAIQNHLLAAAKAAAGYVSAEELDRFHSARDADTPEYRALKERLVRFAEEYRVLYVYYWRDYGDGRIQYIADNDTDPENMYTPKIFFDIDNKEDPVTAKAVPHVLGGGTWVSDLGSYTAGGNGLVSATAPVYSDDGSVYCAAGVDVGDEWIIARQRDARNIMIIQICALTILVLCGVFNLLLYWYGASAKDEAQYTEPGENAAAPAEESGGGANKALNLLLNIATSGKYSARSKFGMSDYLIRYVLLNTVHMIGFLFLLAFLVWNHARASYVDAAVCGVMLAICPLVCVLLRTRVPQIVPASIGLIGYWILCVLLIWNGDYQGYNAVFIYLFPMYAFTSLGMAYGAVLSLALLFVVCVEVFIPGASHFSYQPEIAARIAAAYVMVLFIPFIIEKTRETKDRMIEAQNQRLMELKERAEEANRTKNNFLASMSHEIRTPMNAISGMSELLLRRELGDESKRYAMDIKQASANLLSIINDLLDFSKIEAARLELIPVTYYLSSLLNDVVNIIRTRLVEKPIRFYTNIDAFIPNMLTGDEVRLRQILLNMLGNAVKYTEKGFISVSITQSAREGNRVTLRIDVKDSGVGIKDEDQRKLFGEFVQVDTKRNCGIEGTGLGLAITKRLCEAMGGGISVESEYGRGSVFTAVIIQEIAQDTPFAAVDNSGEKKTLIYEGRLVYAKSVAWSLENMGVPFRLVTAIEDFAQALREEEWYFVFSGYGLYDRIKPVMERLREELPAKKQPPLALMIEWGTEAYVPGVRFVSLPVQTLSIADVLNGAPDRRNYGESGEFSGTRFTAPAARFLVVDDIATNLKVAEGLISPYKARVDTSLSGAEAVEMVKRNAYDIVFMDHMMSPMDGVEATALIREWEAGREAVPIVALTANAVSGMKEMFLSKGFSDFLAKPIDVSKLDDIIVKWLPKEKRIKAGGGSSEARAPGGPDGLKISGIDAARGVAAAGGTEAMYREVLKLYCRDAEARMEFLNAEQAERDMKNFITQVHALKSASASIGADEVSRMAAELEEAGKNGDADFIGENLAAFRENLSGLVDLIKPALAEYAHNAQNWVKAGEPCPADRETLSKLKAALEAEDIGEADALLDELEAMPIGSKTKETLSAVAGLALISEFEAAASMIDDLIKEGFDK